MTEPKAPRMSALPVLQYCGKAQHISANDAGGRRAALGTAFHARCANDDNHLTMYALLSDDEQDELDSLIPPTPITVNGVELEYATARKEVAVLFEGVTGTTDLFWKHDRVLYVGDIKLTGFTAADGPRSLQVIGYAVALLELEENHDVDGYYTGIWDATAGQWSWSEYVDIWSETHQANRDRVRAAAANFGGEFNVGSHCNACYGRTRCPQYLLPPDVANTMLAPFTEPGAINNENALEALSAAQRARDTAEKVIELVKSYAREHGGVRDEAIGKVYLPVECKGRATLDKKRLERDHPELVQSYTKFGSSYSQFKWLNAKEK